MYEVWIIVRDKRETQHDQIAQYGFGGVLESKIQALHFASCLNKIGASIFHDYAGSAEPGKRESL